MALFDSSHVIDGLEAADQGAVFTYTSQMVRTIKYFAENC